MQRFEVHKKNWQHMTLSVKLLLIVVFMCTFQISCDKAENQEGGVVSPEEGEPYIIESVMCVDVTDNMLPVWITDTFTRGDAVTLWIRWGNVSSNHTVTADWFEPDGTLNATIEKEFTAQSDQAITWFSIQTTSDSPAGQWWVAISFDGEFMRSHLFDLIQ